MNEMDFLLEEQLLQGTFPGENLPVTSRKAKSSASELRIFTSTLARLLEGGVPILRSLQIIQKKSGKKPVGKAVPVIEQNIREGQGLSGALHAAGPFPSYFVQMIRAGEISGTLVKVLGLLSDHLAREEETRRKVREALAYPLLVLALGIVTLVVLIQFVIPKIALLYADFDGELPWLTRAVVGLKDAFIPAAAVTLLMSAFGFWFLGKHKGRLQNLIFHLPLLGNFNRKVFLAHFSSLLSLQLQSGIPVLAALDSVIETSSSQKIRKDLERVKESLSQGEGAAKSLEKSFWMSETAGALLLSGEESGKLPEALRQIHEEAMKEVEAQTHFFLKLLEPLLILGVGGVVGTIVTSAILPILEMNTFIQ